MNVFHIQLTRSFLLNFLRTLSALVAILVATLFTVSTAARHHEVTALKAAGWPLHRIMSPLLVMGVVSVPGAVALGANRVSPLVNVLAVLFGVVLGATGRERSRFSGFMTGATILVAFFVVSASVQALGRHGALPTAVADWSPLVLFSALAGFLWVRAAR